MLLVLLIISSHNINFALPEELINYLNINSIDEIDDEILLNLENLYNNTPFLNKLTSEELSNFFWLDSYQKKWILQNKPSTYSILQDSLIIIDEEKISLLKLFTKIPSPKFQQTTQKVKSTSSMFTIRYYTKSITKSESKFKKSNYNLASAMELNYKNYNLYLNTEKDRFETNLFDYYNFSLKINHYNPYFIIGAFNINWGQGLTVWTKYNFNYFVENPLAIKKDFKQLSMYKSFNENNGFHGIALHYQIKQIINEIFLSNSYYDANLNDDNKITSLIDNGYHRTEAEKKKQDILNEKSFGNRISIVNNNFNISFSSLYSKYTPAFGDNLQSDFYQSGQYNYILGIDFEYYYNNNIFFGEIAQSKNSNKGLIIGLSKKIKNVKIALSLRQYDIKFFNIHSRGISYRDKNQNEQGFNFATSYIFRRHKFSIYFDIYKNIKNTGNNIFPTKSQKIYIQYKINNLTFNLLFKKNLEYNINLFTEPAYQTYSYKISYTKKIDKKLTVYTKLNYKHLYYTINKKYDGFLFNIKTKYSINKKMNFLNNIFLFSTDNYDSKIYSYNNNIPTVWSLNSYYNKGYEINNLISYKFNILFLYFKTSFIQKSNMKNFYIGVLTKILF